jgi:exosortase A-associated hydrolase 1
MEETVRFSAEALSLYGILHRPERPASELPFVLMITGGPQTRVGSHRGYVQIARGLCASGACVLRFDYRGIGDAEGAWLGYNWAETSIKAALDWVAEHFPAQRRVALWSLCDGAAASLVFGHRLGSRVAGMVLCNPYVHGEAARAEAILKGYYLRRFTDPAFWKKLLAFKFNPLTFVKSFAGILKSASGARRQSAAAAPEDDPTGFDENTLSPRMIAGIRAFGRPITFLLSTSDITADQFRALLARHKEIGPLRKRGLVSERLIEGADHTFSNLEHKRRVTGESLAALQALRQPTGSQP